MLSEQSPFRDFNSFFNPIQLQRLDITREHPLKIINIFHSSRAILFSETTRAGELKEFPAPRVWIHVN